MYYIMDEEGFRSGGGLFDNIFRSRGERMGAGSNFGINKVRSSMCDCVFGGKAGCLICV
jgi:hypothetical protein